MCDGWDTFLITGKVTDYLKAKAQEQRKHRAGEGNVSETGAQAAGTRQDANALCKADESCRIM